MLILPTQDNWVRLEEILLVHFLKIHLLYSVLYIFSVSIPVVCITQQHIQQCDWYLLMHCLLSYAFSRERCVCSAVCFNNDFLCFAFFVAFLNEILWYFQLRKGKVSKMFPVHVGVGVEMVMNSCFWGQLFHTVSCTGKT